MTPLSKKSELKRLHKIGFGIHWIMPKQKNPVKPWNTKSRDTLETLLKEYKETYNIGTRLSAASKVGKGYLAILDIDIRSSDKAHKDEAIKWVKKNFPGLYEEAPITLSGRSNGSMHIWIRVAKPLAKRRLYASPDEVVTLMPSAKPTDRQKEVLGAKKIKEGWRLRPAFEIDFMCDGCQVVLPPSIHPDTGKPYKWYRNITDASSIPLVDIESMLDAIPENKNKRAGRPTGSSNNAEYDITDVEEFELETRLDGKIVAAIYDGDEVNDRSAMMLTIALSMVRAQFDDAEILGVLTNRDFFIGECAYHHAKTNSRQRAARWASDYCLKKARAEADCKEIFDCEVEVYDTLDEEGKEAQLKNLVSPPAVREWKSYLERTNKGDLRATFLNVKLILMNVVSDKLFKFNLFSQRIHYGFDAPWGRIENESLANIDSIQIKAWLTSSAWGIDPPTSMVDEVVRSIAHENAYHPVKDYLSSLEWDGVPRIRTWMRDYLSATGDDLYLETMSEIFLVAAVARIFQPGVKYDCMIILEGKQGAGKSTVGKVLASPEWFFDSPLDLHDKDSSLSLQGQWIVEMGELANLRKADIATIKSFLSRSTDKFRPPFEKSVVDFDRQCVFFGTTNDSVYLKDPTGNRRFLPVKVGDVLDTKGLSKVRDQLWAEAVMSYDCGTKIYLDSDEIKILAEAAQNEKVIEDTLTVMTDLIMDWRDAVEKSLKLDKNRKLKFKFKIADLFEESTFSSDEEGTKVKAPLLAFRYDNNQQVVMAALALRQAGFENYMVMGRKWWRFSRP